MARKKVEKNISYDDVKKAYYVNLDYGKDETGKRIKKAIPFPKLSDARKARKDYEANKTKGTLVIPKNLTLKDWLDFWISDVITPTREATTVYGYQKIIDNHIIPELGNTPLQQLNAQQIQRYYAKMSKVKNLSQSTIRKHHDLLNTALKLAVKQDILLRNPLEKVDTPKPEEHETDFYTTAQVKVLLEKVTGTRLEIVVFLASYLGLRREEICGLKWHYIDWQKRQVYIREVRTAAGSEVITKSPKSKSSIRTLTIADGLYDALLRELKRQEDNKAYLGSEYNDEGYVAVWANGVPYRPNYLSELFVKFIRDNDLPPITLHGLRHSFASTASSLNIPLFDISKSLGHSTPSITGDLYTHLFDPTHEETMIKVADSLLDSTDMK